MPSMLCTRYTEDDFINILDNRDWSYLAPYAHEDFWLSRRDQHAPYVDTIISNAESMLAQKWPHLDAELYGEFERNGNRSNYESRYFQRRNMLSSWVIAEALERQGRFIPAISKHIPDILAEEKWWVPAHNHHIHRLGSEASSKIVDLFAAETAMLLSSCWRVIGSELHAPELGQSIKQEVEERVLLPLENKARYWWLNGSNNWTPWCCSNALMAAAQLWDDRERFARFAYYLSEAADLFINKYPADGGCDEGPGYWGKATGALFVLLECLHGCSNAQISIFNDDKIKRMAMFIHSAHIHEHWFLNFADAHARMLPAHGLIFRFGQRLDSAELQNFAMHIADLKQKQQKVNKGTTGFVFEQAVQELSWFEPQEQMEELKKDSCLYLPDTEIFIARECKGTDGLVLAAKGGHNAESHNHNDIGQCVIYHNAKPLIIDVGVGTYTKQTFAEGRYDLWPIGAQSHNPPIINGIKQVDGEQYQATNAQFEHSELESSFTVSLVNAYPDNMPCKILQRSCSLKRGENPSVSIVDNFEADEDIQDFEIRLVSPYKPVLHNDRISFDEHVVSLCFAADSLACQIEEKQIDDDKLKIQWGAYLWVITFSMKGSAKQNSLALNFVVG